MKTTRRNFVLLMSLSLFAAVLCMPAQAQAQVYTPYFAGTWVAQVTGTVFFPPPFDKLNGPFARTGRVSMTIDGSLELSSVANFGGFVEKETAQGRYSINPDGVFRIDFVNVPIPTFAGIPNVFTFEGFVAENGRSIKIMLSRINLGGADLPNIGCVLWGELVRQ